MLIETNKIGMGIRRTGAYPRFLDMLSDEDRAFLVARANTKTLAKNETLYVQGDSSEHTFVILEGTVKAHYIQDNGSSLTTSYCREGMLIGAHGCTSWSGNPNWSAQALAPSRVLLIERKLLIDLTKRSGDALRCLLALTEFKAEQLKKVIQILAEAMVERRIWLALQHLGELYGISHGDEVEIDGRFTHQEIAEMVGTTRQSVTTLLSGLERADAIRRDRGRIFIRPD